MITTTTSSRRSSRSSSSSSATVSSNRSKLHDNYYGRRYRRYNNEQVSNNTTSNHNNDDDDDDDDDDVLEYAAQVERELIEKICHWSRWTIMWFGAMGGLIGYVFGKETYIYPLMCSVCAIVVRAVLWRNHHHHDTTTTTSNHNRMGGERSSSSSRWRTTTEGGNNNNNGNNDTSALLLQTSIIISFTCLMVMQHALSHGCSASLVPVIFGFIPIVFSSIFRSIRAVVFSTLGILFLVGYIFITDLSGHCTTQPIDPNDVGAIVFERLTPMLMLIIGNASLLRVIAQQSQHSLLAQAKAAKSAARLAQIRRDLLHRITHELRTPLNGIVGSVELLTSSESMMESNNPSDMENAQTIQKCLKHILQICDDVLMVAKMESVTEENGVAAAASSAGAEVDTDPCNDDEDDDSSSRPPFTTNNQNETLSCTDSLLQQQQQQQQQQHNKITRKTTRTIQQSFRLISILDDVTNMFAATAVSKNISFKVQYQGDTKLILRGMPMELRHVLLNLVGNAIKFTEEGSVILRVTTTTTTTITNPPPPPPPPTSLKYHPETSTRIATHAATTANTTTETNKSDSNVIKCQFEVEDTGVGISKEESKMLFEPFYQGGRGAVVRKHKGTGLGLTICRTMVQSMGGGDNNNITVEPGVDGRGSKFSFTVSFPQDDTSTTTTTTTTTAVPASSSAFGGDDECHKSFETVENHRNCIQGDDDKSCSFCGRYDIIVADMEKESAISCISIAKSVLPSASVREAGLNPWRLLNKIAGECDQVSGSEVLNGTADTCHIVFVECKSAELDNVGNFVYTLSRLKQAGWKIFAYCDHPLLPKLKEHSNECFAVFRRPIQLAKIEALFRESLAEKKDPLAIPENWYSNNGSMTMMTVQSPGSEKNALKSSQEEMFATKVDATNASSISSIVFKDNTDEVSPDQCIGKTNRVLTAVPSFPKPTTKPTISKPVQFEFPPGTKIVVVDDTSINVKVLVKMLSRSVSVPIISCFGGQESIDVFTSAAPTDKLLFLMDWHMPGICGLTATQSIRNLSQQQGGRPRAYIIMVTADGEGLEYEMQKRKIRPTFGNIVKGNLVPTKPAHRCQSQTDDHAAIDIVAVKPVTLKAIDSMLLWFQEQG